MQSRKKKTLRFNEHTNNSMVDERVIQAKKQAIERDLIIDNSKRAQIVSDWFDNLQKRKSFQNALERTQPIDYNQITQITDSSEQRSEQQIASTLMTKLISLIGNPRISHQIILNLSPDESMILNDKFDSFKTSWNTSKRSKIEFETLLAEIKLFCRPYVNALRGINTTRGGGGLGGYGGGYGGVGGLSGSFSFGSDNGLTSFPQGMAIPLAPKGGIYQPTSQERSFNLDDFEMSLADDDEKDNNMTKILDPEGFKNEILGLQAILLKSTDQQFKDETEHIINTFLNSCINHHYLGREYRNETDVSYELLSDLLIAPYTDGSTSGELLIEFYNQLDSLAEQYRQSRNSTSKSAATPTPPATPTPATPTSATATPPATPTNPIDKQLGDIKELSISDRQKLAVALNRILMENDITEYNKRFKPIKTELNVIHKHLSGEKNNLVDGRKTSFNKEMIKKLISDHEINFFLAKLSENPSKGMLDFITNKLNKDEIHTREDQLLRALFSNNKLVKKLSTPNSPVPREEGNKKGKTTGKGIDDCKYFVDQNMLDKNKLCIKYKSTNNYKMKPIDISTDLSNVVKDILDDRFSHTNRDYNRLNQKEKQILSLFIQKMKLESNIKLPDNELDKMYNQWIILKDERSAGNDSVEVKNKLRQMTLTMLEIGKVSKSTAYNLLYELSL